MKSKLKISSLLIAIACLFLFVSCKQTDDDKMMTEQIIGHWGVYTEDNEKSEVFPEYHFQSGGEGKTTLLDYSDDMTWEIIRNELKVFYDDSPKYVVGYDKYNSRSKIYIDNFEADEIKVTFFVYNGLQYHMVLKKED